MSLFYFLFQYANSRKASKPPAEFAASRFQCICLAIPNIDLITSLSFSLCGLITYGNFSVSRIVYIAATIYHPVLTLPLLLLLLHAPSQPQTPSPNPYLPTPSLSYPIPSYGPYTPAQRKHFYLKNTATLLSHVHSRGVNYMFGLLDRVRSLRAGTEMARASRRTRIYWWWLSIDVFVLEIFIVSSLSPSSWKS